MSIILLAEAKTFLNITKTDKDDWVQTLIDAAENTVQKYIGLDLSVQAGLTVTLNGEGTYFQRLPRPLTTLTSLSIDDVAHTISDYYVRDEYMIERKDKTETFTDTTLQNVEVLGDWGWATWPEELEVATLQLIAWLYQMNKDQISISSRQYQGQITIFIQHLPTPIAMMLGDFKVSGL